MAKQMDLKTMLAEVRNDRVEFATMRPDDSPFVLLERRVVVTRPPELVALSKMGDPQVLEELVPLLKDPDRAWAAAVLLAALTRREEKIVDSFAAVSGEWWDAVGATAYERWSKWLKDKKEKLVWDSENGLFVEAK